MDSVEAKKRSEVFLEVQKKSKVIGLATVYLLVTGRKYMQWLGNTLGFQKADDWYRITQKDLTDHYGGGMLTSIYRGKLYEGNGYYILL